MLRGPAYLSIFTFSLVQLGIAGANRILALMREETELDENEAGHRGEVRGEIVFDHVSFSYGETPDPARHLFPRRARRDHRHRRPDRLRQEHADATGQPHLRRDRRAHPDRWRGRARLESGCPALADIVHRAGCLSLLAQHRREYRLQHGPAGRTRRDRARRARTPRPTALCTHCPMATRR